MSSITDFLNLISGARYGREVRQAIVDAISQCYEDGKAGANDLEARRLIEAAIAVNEEHEVDIADLRMQIAEIIGGGSSSETVGTTTTEVPTVIFDTGTEDVYVQSQANSTRAVAFNKTFTETPVVICEINWRDTGNKNYAFLAIAPANITTSGFDIIVTNYINKPLTPTVRWIAIQPTTVDVNTEIISPSGGGMTETQVRAITNPIQTTLDSIKTGYDSTVYTSPGDAVRTQIAALWAEIDDIKDRLDALEG